MLQDSEIVALYLQRNEKAIAESSAKYGSYCFAVAHNLLDNRQDAEECVNDTWLRSWNSIPPQKPIRLSAFFAKITRNLALDKWEYARTKKRGGMKQSVPYDELGDIADGANGPEDILAERNLGQDIDRFLRNIPKRDANLFIRRYFFTESVREIAARGALTENHVSAILSRTRRKLKDFLRKEGYRL